MNQYWISVGRLAASALSVVTSFTLWGNTSFAALVSLRNISLTYSYSIGWLKYFFLCMLWLIIDCWRKILSTCCILLTPVRSFRCSGRTFEVHFVARPSDQLSCSEELQGVNCMLNAAGWVFSWDWGHLSYFVILVYLQTCCCGSASSCHPSPLRLNLPDHRNYTNCGHCYTF